MGWETTEVIARLLLAALVIALVYLRIRQRNEPAPTCCAEGARNVADDFRWLFPPDTMESPDAWDGYWEDQLSHGAAFFHIFVHDEELVDVMRASGLRTVLCVGAGMSAEPHALAWAGFDVTALDLSPFAMEVAGSVSPSDEVLASLVGDRPGGPSGRLEFVVGDLCDPACCPGPYDVVIERRTLQLYSGSQFPVAMQAVASRVATPGIFFSHSHDNRWKPPAKRRNPPGEWFVAEGWRLWKGKGPLTDRVAWVLTTTG